jgi:hypothetical protein
LDPLFSPYKTVPVFENARFFVILSFPCRRRRRRRLQWRKRRGTALRRMMRVAVTFSVLMTPETSTYLSLFTEKTALELNT